MLTEFRAELANTKHFTKRLVCGTGGGSDGAYADTNIDCSHIGILRCGTTRSAGGPQGKLVRMNGGATQRQRHNWLLIKHHDCFERPGDGDTLLEEDRSVASGRTMAAIVTRKGRPPTPFMLGGDSNWQSDAVWAGTMVSGRRVA